MSSATPRLRLSSPTDILTAVPFLIGFHPEHSLVVIGFIGQVVRVSTRWDLPIEQGSLDGLLPLLKREQVTMAVLIGYGPGSLVTTGVDEATRLLRSAGIEITESLRASDNRYWSYLCQRIACCPPEGTPYDPKASPIAAEAVVNGLVALPNRRSLERSVAPCHGVARLSMNRATTRAITSIRTALAKGRPADLVADGIARVRTAIDVYARGDRLTDDEIARLGLDLSIIRVRDEAWTLIDDRDAHLTLWRDVTQRLHPRHAAPAASLLAATAWRNGDCALATLALDRALTADPRYTMAVLLSRAIRNLLPPNVLRDRMPTPEDLDREMGTPTTKWLTPLLTLLEDPPALAS
ncbi:hypothetical protein Aph01nite_67070 [Acrocarpospora phusangensis]|uniref:DUF4192 domain-containing protein n=1 Tax=Acrocarpospora phusangensis TaxID=1070424 RepID=A0A919URT3_9ACTN|nr:DUF4192 domain-containing protein [Acrocarpospora phusangensis]GIH28397.1 hypothetical protein Aph01nite_67070 [Acrocarpospora phusangensis]